MPKVSEEHKSKVKSAIYQAALKNFSRNGYASTKMEDIAKAANISKGAIYLYFQSKEDLFYHMCKQNQQTLLEVREGLFKSNATLTADLGKFYDDLVRKEKDTERAWLEGVTESLHNKKLNRMVLQQRNNLEDIVTEFLKQMKTDGDFFKNDTELRSIARGMIALYNGLTLMRLTGNDCKSIKETWVSTMRSIISGT